jgi:hypothetical protein
LVAWRDVDSRRRPTPGRRSLLADRSAPPEITLRGQKRKWLRKDMGTIYTARRQRRNHAPAYRSRPFAHTHPFIVISSFCSGYSNYIRGAQGRRRLCGPDPPGSWPVEPDSLPVEPGSLLATRASIRARQHNRRSQSWQRITSGQGTAGTHEGLRYR